MKKNDLVYLRHILDSISRIEEYVKGIKHGDFMKKPLIQDAVIRQIEIIGEATKNLSAEMKEKYSHIPWKDIAGMRDKVIHDYLGVDLDAVWYTVEKDIAELKREIKAITEKEGIKRK